MKIKIAGNFYDYFNDFRIDTSLDAVASSFSFTALYDPENPDHRFLFKPFSYHRVEFYGDDNERLSTGTLVAVKFSSESERRLVLCSGYSLGGVLEDCNIPYSSYPLESNNLTLKQIGSRFLAPFKLNLVVYDIVKTECDQVITKTVATPEETIKGYISKLAAQKNVVVSHDVFGNVIFFRPDPAAKSKGLYTKENTVSIDGDYNGQGLHSEITTLRQPTKNNKNGGLFDDEDSSDADSSGLFADGEKSKLTAIDSVKNELVKAYRPKVDVLSSGTITDTALGSKNTRANELKDSISVSFTLNRWDKISIGDIIEILDDEIFIAKRTRFMIASTSINENAESRTMSATCVLPETFTGNLPKYIFA